MVSFLATNRSLVDSASYVTNKNKGCVCVQVSMWSVEELRLRLASLDPQMEQEIEEIRQRYQAKRKPIQDAIEAKKRQQQKF